MQSSVYAEQLLHTGALTQRGLYTERLLRTEIFTRKLYTEKLLHREASKQSIFYTQKPIYTHKSFNVNIVLINPPSPPNIKSIRIKLGPNIQLS